MGIGCAPCKFGISAALVLACPELAVGVGAAKAAEAAISAVKNLGLNIDASAVTKLIDQAISQGGSIIDNVSAAICKDLHEC